VSKFERKFIFYSDQSWSSALIASKTSRYEAMVYASKLIQLSQCLTSYVFRECYEEAHRNGDLLKVDSPLCIGCHEQLPMHGHGRCV
jgi:hypothetical protein